MSAVVAGFFSGNFISICQTGDDRWWKNFLDFTSSKEHWRRMSAEAFWSAVLADGYVAAVTGAAAC